MPGPILWRRFIYDTVIQIVPVALGVYLGLLASNCNDLRKEEALSERVLANLDREIGHNRDVLLESYPYFSQLLDSLSTLPTDSDQNPASFSFWKGLNPPLLKRAAYESASMTGILANLYPELLEQLALTYQLAEDLKEQSELYVKSVTEKIGDPGFNNRQYRIILENYCFDLLTAEAALNKELKNTLGMMRADR